MSCPNPCCSRPKHRPSRCVCIAIGFLVLLLVFTIGLIVGAYNAQIIISAIAALIAFAAAIAAILIAIVLMYCKRCE